ncbi:uncharacterized protein LOC120078506 [Benincasa hispida]|uniref:uncharacterized protein LOC120078506 n=1 Tax=Benincasa hispida TaxID=102211 RepID=UPI0018FF268C|nr:uncharacterized protein LOC120078506 [Benincasa hispida]
MVLWEIALATAYFLGLKRTFKLALKTQRRLVSPKHPRIRQFLRGRTRAVFDVSVKVHHTIQRQDIKVSTKLSSWISRWLNQMKPSAETHEHPNGTINTGMKMIKKVSNSYLKHQTSSRAVIGRKFDQYLSSTSSVHRWPKPFFPTIAMIMRQRKPAGTLNQYRQFSICGSDGLKTNYRRRSFDHGIREDIMQWMLQN